MTILTSEASNFMFQTDTVKTQLNAYLYTFLAKKNGKLPGSQYFTPKDFSPRFLKRTLFYRNHDSLLGNLSVLTSLCLSIISSLLFYPRTCLRCLSPLTDAPLTLTWWAWIPPSLSGSAVPFWVQSKGWVPGSPTPFPTQRLQAAGTQLGPC